MTANPKCQAKGGVANCQDPNCPERIAQRGILSKDAFAKQMGVPTGRSKPRAKAKVSEAEQARRDEAKAAKYAEMQELLVNQIALLDTEEGWNAYLENAQKWTKYSFQNQLLIMAAGGTDVAGYEDWQKKFDRHVVAGGKGITLIAPVRKAFDRVDGNGNPILGANGKPLKDYKVLSGRFTTTTVFDVSQTDGKPLPEHDRPMTELPPEGFREDLHRNIEAEGYTVTYAPMSGTQKGSTIPGTKRVVIKEGMTPADEVRVLAHELGHIKQGHTEHLDEYHDAHQTHRGRMEVEAETFALFVNRANGMKSDDLARNSAAYVKGWATSDPEHLRKSGTSIAKAVKATLSGGSWKNVITELLG
jgi:antirestriction protein ArdC